MLESTEKGEVRKTVGNYRLILMNDPNLQGAFRLNMFTDKIDITRDLGWYRESDSLTDVDLKFLVVYLEKHYGLSNEKRIEDVIKVVANENRYHPVLDRINSITWDGRERIRYALHCRFCRSKSAGDVLRLCSVSSVTSHTHRILSVRQTG